MKKTTAEIRRELAGAEAELAAARDLIQELIPPLGRTGRQQIRRANHRLLKLFRAPLRIESLECSRDVLKTHLEIAESVERDERRLRTDGDRKRLVAWIYRRLRKMGFIRETESGASRYYALGNFQVRISDHEVPLTAERSNAYFTGGRTWAESGWSLVVEEGSRAECWRAARWLVDVRRQVKFMA